MTYRIQYTVVHVHCTLVRYCTVYVHCKCVQYGGRHCRPASKQNTYTVNVHVDGRIYLWKDPKVKSSLNWNQSSDSLNDNKSWKTISTNMGHAIRFNHCEKCALLQFITKNKTAQKRYLMWTKSLCMYNILLLLHTSEHVYVCLNMRHV